MTFPSRNNCDYISRESLGENSYSLKVERKVGLCLSCAQGCKCVGSSLWLIAPHTIQDRNSICVVINARLSLNQMWVVTAEQRHARKIPVHRGRKGDHPKGESTLLRLSYRMWHIVSESRTTNQDFSCIDHGTLRRWSCDGAWCGESSSTVLGGRPMLLRGLGRSEQPCLNQRCRDNLD